MGVYHCFEFQETVLLWKYEAKCYLPSSTNDIYQSIPKGLRMTWNMVGEK